MLFSPLFVLMAVFAKYGKGGRYTLMTTMTTIISTMVLKFHSKQNLYLIYGTDIAIYLNRNKLNQTHYGNT